MVLKGDFLMTHNELHQTTVGVSHCANHHAAPPPPWARGALGALGALLAPESFCATPPMHL